ncbi:acyl-CoA desaturase [Actomonas aquatica]|uniref:Acyl-CoA desaturase n=1 Tax=Actomonas aquatica TaxID=2866162 RepID=A0ABZ1CE95_9BACT|nr:acyl-CoA desaturase [Opitutus sp. WL0086]WRQ89808.1 acyl-CoA desaturase [Opitutus sp. WL0086]
MSAPARPLLSRLKTAVVQWIDADYCPDGPEKMRQEPDKVDWVRVMPFAVLHLGCFGVIWTGWSPFAAWSAVALYFLRMFAVTGIYHRYFSHKTYSTSRFGQFLLAVWGGTTVQRGPLWWAYHHRHHHQHSDDEEDAHSPHVHGFWWSHIGWITSRRNFPTDYSKVKDLAKFPELVFLNRFDIVVPLLFAASMFGLGAALERFAPGLGTTGPQMLVWGFFISTTALFHGTSCINSMAHLMGRRRFKTTDDSRNSFILAIICLGEGWHNNHHRYQSSTRNGFYWWEIDPTYYGLKLLSWTGLIWGFKAVPQSVLAEGEHADHHRTVEAAARSEHVHVRSSLKKVVPTATALAVGTIQAAQAEAPKQPERPGIHKDTTELTVDKPDAKPAN